MPGLVSSKGSNSSLSWVLAAEIGRDLHITEATVKPHLLRVFGKLEVSDRTAAVTVARDSGLP